jgi:Phage stabilisation protein
MQLNLLGLGLQGRSPNVSAQRRLNLYLELHADAADKTTVSAHGTPGVTLFADMGETPVRGMYGVGDNLYFVHRFSLYSANNAGVITSLGTLSSSTGAVGFADNGIQVMITDGTKGYIYTIATGVLAEISAAGYPDNATSVTFLDGYFIVDSPSEPGRFYVSALYDGTNWEALAYATAESNPDNLVRPLAERSLLHLFGEYTTEVWADTGGLNFPFSPMQGAAVEWGLAARWSLAKFDDSLIWLARNRLGQVSVVRAAGVDIQRVSTSELDYLFSTYSAVSDATGFGAMYNGHPMYYISFPSASRSWLFDGKTGAWSELQSYGLTRHRGATQTSFLNEIMVGDYSDGRIYKLRGDSLTDDGDPIIREIQSPHTFGPDYNNFFMSELRVDVETGVGVATGQGSAPMCMLQISRDNGHSFGTEKWATLGKTGEYKARARFRRLGRARDATFKLRISDPIKVVILGASLMVEPGAA